MKPLLPLVALSLSLGACATKTHEGPLAPLASAPVAHTGSGTQHTAGPVATPTPRPTPRPTPTPDPFAPTPIPQKPQIPGVSPLSHGADQPLYQRQQ